MCFPRTLVLSTLILACAAARALAAATGYTVYISDERSADVSVVDGVTRAVKATWHVGKRPRGIHVSPDGTRLYVAVSGSPIMGPGAHEERAKANAPDKAADGIAIVDTATGRVLRKLSVGSDPEQFALSTDGQRVIVSNEDESAASCWDLSSGRRVFQTRVSGEPEGVSVHPTRDEVYVTCEQQGDIFVLNARNGAQLATAHVRGRPRSVAFLPDGSRAYVPAEGEAEVSVMDTATHQIARTVKIPGEDALPMCAVASPNGRFVYVSTGRGNTVAIIDAGTNAVAATIPVGQRPWGIALSPDGKTLFAANGRSDDVSVVDLEQRKEVARIKVAKGPWGVAVAGR
jgi:YVTN family beta-propeller protein